MSAHSNRTSSNYHLHDMGQQMFKGSSLRADLSRKEIPLISEKEAFDLMSLLPQWTRSKDNYVLLHEMRAAMLAFPEFTPNSAAQVMMFAQNPVQPNPAYTGNLPPCMQCIKEAEADKKKSWLKEYADILCTLGPEVLKRHFDSPKHMLFDLRGIGSLMTGHSRAQVANLYKAFYTMEDIPNDVLAILGVNLSLVPSLVKPAADNEVAPPVFKESYLTTATQRTGEKHTNDSKLRTSIKTGSKRFMFASSDESIKDAVDFSLKNLPYQYTWRKTDDKMLPDVYFMRFDNRNTCLKELQDMGNDTVLVVGYFPFKLGTTERGNLELDFKAKVSKVAWTEVFNDDSQDTTELRFRDLDVSLKSINL